MFDKFINYFYSGRNWYYLLTKKTFLFSARLENLKLADELEEECNKQGGILTYSQYHQIDQFGKNGYNAHSNSIGSTNMDKRWGEALANFCRQNNYNYIIEFGCGNGELGIATVKAFKKLSNKPITWLGIEINTSLHENIKKKFTDEKLENSFGGIVTSLDSIQKINRTLFVFPYAVDSIPPEIFVNTRDMISYPDAIIGVRIENGVLREQIIPQELLKMKGRSLNNGFYKRGKHTFDLRTWKLRKGQRAYIQTNALAVLSEYAARVSDDCACIIIDEFRNNPFSFGSGVLGIPKDLYKKKECKDIEKYYRQTGKNYLYFSIYFDTFYKFLHFFWVSRLSYLI